MTRKATLILTGGTALLTLIISSFFYPNRPVEGLIRCSGTGCSGCARCGARPNDRFDGCDINGDGSEDYSIPFCGCCDGFSEVGGYCWAPSCDSGGGGGGGGDDGGGGVVTPPTYGISGKVWLTEAVCTEPRDDVPNFQSSAKVKAASSSGTEYTGSVNLSTGEYNINSVPAGTVISTLCVEGLTPPRDTNYNLSCYESAPKTPIGNCFSLDQAVNGNWSGKDLGVINKSVLKGWFTSLNGDVYGTAFNMPLPDSPAAGWNPSYMIYGSNFAFTSSAFNLGGDGKISQQNNNAQNINVVDNWLNYFSFSPPGGAQNLPSFNTPLDPNTVYKIDSGALNVRLQNNVGYKVQSNGVVVIYITGSTKVIFGKEFVSNSADGKKRILFVSEPPVEIAASLGTAVPAPSGRASIEAGIVSKEDITFASSGTSTPSDISVIVEGLVASAKSIKFNRDRGLNNKYPAQIIKQYDYYLGKLSLQERQSSIFNYTGLSNVDAYWEVN